MKNQRQSQGRRQSSSSGSRKLKKADSSENKSDSSLTDASTASRVQDHSFKHALMDISALRTNTENKPQNFPRQQTSKQRVSFKHGPQIQVSTGISAKPGMATPGPAREKEHKTRVPSEVDGSGAPPGGSIQRKKQGTGHADAPPRFDPVALQLVPAPSTSGTPLQMSGSTYARPGSILAALDEHPSNTQKSEQAGRSSNSTCGSRLDDASVSSTASTSDVHSVRDSRGAFTMVSPTGARPEFRRHVAEEESVHMAAEDEEPTGQTLSMGSAPASDNKERGHAGGVSDGTTGDLHGALDKLVLVDPKSDGVIHRPKVCMDVGDPVKDLLFVSNIPKDMTYDRLQDLVDPFGEVALINWNANDSDCAEIVYDDPSSAEEAMHYLHDSIVGGSDDAPLRAELRSRDPGTQLFVGDLTPDVTERMLETTFSKLVQSPVSATLKRDPGSYSPIGYGFLTFENEFAASQALVQGHRIKVGNASVRVGRAERNTFLYVTDLNPDIRIDELKDVFEKHGSIVDEDTVIVRRSYAFIRYRNRASAESAKRSLDKTSLRGRMTVRYAEAEPVKSTVQVQFHSSVPRPPSSLKDLLHSTFSKYGNCSIEVPRLNSGMWRKAAFVQYHGDPIAAALAATEAVQNVKFVSTIPVLCQFARELIPRVSPKGVPRETMPSRGGENRGCSTSRVRDMRTHQHGSTPFDPKTPRRLGEQHGGGNGGRVKSWHQGSEAFVQRVGMEFQGHRRSKDVSIEDGSQGKTYGDENMHPNSMQPVSGIVHGYGRGIGHGPTGVHHHGPPSFQGSCPREAVEGGFVGGGGPGCGVQHANGGVLEALPRLNDRAAHSASPSTRDDEHESQGGDVAYMPVYLPVSAMGNPFALSGMPGLLTESEFANATAGFMTPQYTGPLTPQFSAPISPIVYPNGAVGGPSSGPPLFGYPMPHAGSMQRQQQQHEATEQDDS